MKRLRFAFACLALGLASTATTAQAEILPPCPSIISLDGPYYTCGLRSGAYCNRCQYECSDGQFYWWNVCGG